MRWDDYYARKFPGGIEVFDKSERRGSVTIEEREPSQKTHASQASLKRWIAAQRLEEAGLYRQRAKWDAASWTKVRALETLAAELNAEADALADLGALDLETECAAAMLLPPPTLTPIVSRAEKLRVRIRQARWMADLADWSGYRSPFPVDHWGRVAALEAELRTLWDWSENVNDTQDQPT